MKNTLIALIALISFTMTAQKDNLNPMIHVSGEGIINITPDQVTVRVRVENQGDEPATVKRANDQAIDAVIKFLRTQGIKDKHVQSDYINLNKNYDYNKKTYHYTANQTLTIVVKDLSKYESVMSGLLASGINRIDGVTFGAENVKAKREEARVMAVLDAKHKAETYANALGQGVGKAVKISENGGYDAPQPIYKARMMSMEADSAGQETIAPGELAVKVTVQVSFELK